jgi:hypothetical protein
MIHSRSGHRRRCAAVTAATLALLAPPAAGAAERPPRPDELAAVSVYREQIPTASGPRVADTTGASSGGVPLAPDAQAAVREAGPDAKALERAATSPVYGAPDRRLAPADTAGEEGALGAALEVASGTDTGRLLGLVLVLAAVSAALGAAAARSRRAG